MDQDGRDRFEIPKEMRSVAEAGFDQTRKAFEHIIANAQQTATTIEDRGATVRANAKEITTKAVSFAERNVSAALDYAQQLVHAKDLGDVLRLHSEYVQGQMKALAEQAAELGQVVTKAAQDAVKPKS
ncbi:Phasin 2 [Rhodopseudomonas palustris HaA2]|uniref:Phasin 2 n=1 Tax=Rhodopseudomonas palustris (strain HaA2) TaxID=316058 RepID=Q2J030_RHOP2|nr:phasin [Rhodopseudomonas palustris]ABD06180.1 Phasin 2 [Rhodopseudomonas palustris HaA2]